MSKREKIQYAIVGMLALLGIVLIVVRPWGMRFSGFFLLGAAVLLVIDALLTKKAENGKGWRRLKWVFSKGLLLLTVVLVSIEVFVLNKGSEDLVALPTDAVIVLGAGVNGTEPSLSLWTRLNAALDYLEYRNTDCPVVLTGGKGYGEEISEAQCMYNWLTARGVDPDRLILEEKAANTAENFAFSKALLAENGVDPDTAVIAVVTNDFHIAQAELIAEWKTGYGAVIGVPAKLPWLHLEINYYLREAFAVVKTVIFD